MSKAEVRKNFEELAHWYTNMTREGIDESMQIIGRMLASLPGGDEFEDLGFEPYDWLGWHEFELITDALQSIDGKLDVEEAASILFATDEDEEDE
jgi:hypothetical protein